MLITQQSFQTIRDELLHNLDDIINAERLYATFLLDITLKAANGISEDFGKANDLYPLWKNYQPRQRGRSPIGNSIPWIEVAEKTVSAHIMRALSLQGEHDGLHITYPGLPLGGDVRFAVNDVLIHFDVKATGPNDNSNEIVASPHQISGDGGGWNDGGIVNTSVAVPRRGQKTPMLFQPSLPPFYILDSQRKLCLTYFLKVNYIRLASGEQPLDYLELVCVPNGLLLFVDPDYHIQTPGLFIAGKDDKSVANPRTRVRFDPLVKIADWRCIKLKRGADGWVPQKRSEEISSASPKPRSRNTIAEGRSNYVVINDRLPFL